MLAGRRTCVDMEDYGCACEAWVYEFMTLENGIPSHDTFSQVFEKTSERSPTHLLLAVRVGGEADLGADRGGRPSRTRPRR